MGKTVAIVCNGDFPKKAYPLYLLDSADFIICCDGAAEAYLRHVGRGSAAGRAEASGVAADLNSYAGSCRMPDIVIGDLDSLKPSIAKKLGDRVVHVREQETNDLSKALRYVLENVPSADHIIILGASGKREDHTIGNLSLLMEFAGHPAAINRGIAIEAVSDWSTAFAIHESGEIHCGEGRSVSIFTCDPTLRIKSAGLTWPTDDVVFDNWWKATLNRASEDVIKLQLSHPAPVLIILN